MWPAPIPCDVRQRCRKPLVPFAPPITKRVYNLGLDEFFEWYGQEPRPGFTKATVAAWRCALEARGLGAVSINVRITTMRKLAVEAVVDKWVTQLLWQGDAKTFKKYSQMKLRREAVQKLNRKTK